jgi:hypothetical protein
MSTDPNFRSGSGPGPTQIQPTLIVEPSSVKSFELPKSVLFPAINPSTGGRARRMDNVRRSHPSKSRQFRGAR